MNVTIIGTGYVGLPTGIGLAELGHKVTCVDSNHDKIKDLNSGKITLFEDGLEELFIKNREANKISFTTSMKEGVEFADVIMIAVGTPPHPETQEADMKYIHAAASEMAQYLQGYTVIVNKSTVPVGTGDEVEKIIKSKNSNADFDVVSIPEFLREGFAVYDFFNPDRIVVGANNEKSKLVILDLYKKFDGKTEFLFVTRRSSETIKYASNAFLAIKIHYINEMANFCEKVNANISEVAMGMGQDTRIGRRFLNPGPGYGGSCFPKDTLAMAHMGRKNNVDLSLIETAIRGNDLRKAQMAQKVVKILEKIENPKIAVLGLAFKNGTDDCRESPAIQVIESILNVAPEVSISAYDPQANENAKALLGDSITYGENIYETLNQADAMVVLTEWDEFKEINFSEAKTLMRKANIIDFRNILSLEAAQANGFKYYGIGVKQYD